LAKNNASAKKSKSGQKSNLKKAISRFNAKIAADTGFRSAALKQRKNTTNNKKSKLFKMLYCIFVTFLQFSDTCQIFFGSLALLFLFSLLLLQIW